MYLFLGIFLSLVPEITNYYEHIHQVRHNSLIQSFIHSLVMSWAVKARVAPRERPNTTFFMGAPKRNFFTGAPKQIFCHKSAPTELSGLVAGDNGLWSGGSRSGGSRRRRFPA